MARQLVLVTGPIGAGKSTVAGALASALTRRHVETAVVDLDDIVFMQRTRAGLDEFWRRGRLAHAAVVATWFQEGVTVVVAHGPFLGPDEEAPLLAAVPEVVVRRLVLWAPYEAALQRVSADPTRGLSADPDFLREAHVRFRKMANLIPTPDWEVDTTTAAVDDIAERVAGDVVAAA